jgi:peptide methionine sulfoxide reductase MsrA
MIVNNDQINRDMYFKVKESRADNLEYLFVHFDSTEMDVIRQTTFILKNYIVWKEMSDHKSTLIKPGILRTIRTEDAEFDAFFKEFDKAYVRVSQLIESEWNRADPTSYLTFIIDELED